MNAHAQMSADCRPVYHTTYQLTSSSGFYCTVLTCRSIYSDVYCRVLTCRGMYIVNSHNGCPYDFVYLVTIQNQEITPCPWERFDNADLPKILYSNDVNEASNALQRKLLAVTIDHPLTSHAQTTVDTYRLYKHNK